MIIKGEALELLKAALREADLTAMMALADLMMENGDERGGMVAKWAQEAMETESWFVRFSAPANVLGLISLDELAAVMSD